MELVFVWMCAHACRYVCICAHVCGGQRLMFLSFRNHCLTFWDKAFH